MTYRCFFALELPEPLKTSLSQRLKEFSAIPGVNWTRPENLHLTMLFLGDVEVGLISQLKGLQADIAEAWKAVNLSARGIELFPARDPRLAWVSLKAEDKAVFNLHKELLGRVKALDIEVDARPLKLHVTLGRIKRQMAPHLERSVLGSPVDTELFKYDRFSLYRSQLRPEGPVYNIIEQSILQ